MEKHKTVPIKDCQRVLEERKTTGRKKLISNNIVEMINERNKYKNATDQQDMEKYRSLRNVINKECRKSKEEFFDSICTDVNE